METADFKCSPRAETHFYLLVANELGPPDWQYLDACHRRRSDRMGWSLPLMAPNWPGPMSAVRPLSAAKPTLLEACWKTGF